jgi:hypothetical protein
VGALLMLPLQQERRQLAGQWLVRVRDQVAALQGQEVQHLATVTERQLAGQWLVRVRDQVAALQGQEVQHLVNRGLTISTIDKKLSVCIHSLNFLLSVYMILKSVPLLLHFLLPAFLKICETFQNFSTRKYQHEPHKFEKEQNI